VSGAFRRCSGSLHSLTRSCRGAPATQRLAQATTEVFEVVLAGNFQAPRTCGSLLPLLLRQLTRALQRSPTSRATLLDKVRACCCHPAQRRSEGALAALPRCFADGFASLSSSSFLPLPSLAFGTLILRREAGAASLSLGLCSVCPRYPNLWPLHPISHAGFRPHHGTHL
jgi:hypothetical protein